MPPQPAKQPLSARLAAAGDSRCVLSKRGQARALTLDHKPILFEEAKRIIKASGWVFWF